jgi:hypothetical protein
MDSPGRLTRSGAKLAGRSLPPSETARAYGGWSDRTRGPLAQHLDTMDAFMRSSRPGSTHEELHSSRGFSVLPRGVGGSEDRPPRQLSLPDRARTPICPGLHSFSSSVADQPHHTEQQCTWSLTNTLRQCLSSDSAPGAVRIA